MYIRKFFNNLLWVFFITLSVGATAQENVPEKNQQIELEVYKTPTCGCCKKWVSHIVDQGIGATTHDFQDIGKIKSKYNINAKFQSCHSAISKEGYVFEGHVPAKFIKLFLAQEHPDALGLAVPGMPLGSPGMEVGERFMPYEILLLLKDGSSEVFAMVKHYEEQF